MENSADPDQLASSEVNWLHQKSADLDLQCFLTRMYHVSA